MTFRRTAATAAVTAEPGTAVPAGACSVDLVPGVAAGAGASLALAGDIRLWATSTVFVEVFSNIALIPDSGSTWFLPRLVGFNRAFELMALAEKVTAEEALRVGLCEHVYPDDTFVADVQAYARAHDIADPVIPDLLPEVELVAQRLVVDDQPAAQVEKDRSRPHPRELVGAEQPGQQAAGEAQRRHVAAGPGVGDGAGFVVGQGDDFASRPPAPGNRSGYARSGR